MRAQTGISGDEITDEVKLLIEIGRIVQLVWLLLEEKIISAP